MKACNFTSASDRRWKNRYDTIVRRKEENFDYLQRKKELKLDKRRLIPLDFSAIDKTGVLVVACPTKDR